MGNALGQVITVITAIVGVAVLSVLVSRNSQTPKVIEAFGDAVSGMIGAATAPVTGGMRTPLVG